MSKKDSDFESEFELKTSHKIVALLVSLMGSIAAISTFLDRLESVRIKQAQYEVKFFYIEKKIAEHEKFKKWCEDLYNRPREKWKD